MNDAAFTTYLFDLDGTLLDTVDLIVFSYRHTLKAHLGTVPPDEVFLKGLGTPLHTILQGFSNVPEEVEAMVETYRIHNLEHHDAMVKPYEGALEAVQQLKARGRRLALVTSKARSMAERGLEVCGFSGLMEAVVAAEDVARHKPHPEAVNRALDILGADPGGAVFIGDSPHDLAAGHRAGVKTAAVLWGPFPRGDLELHTPDHWLHRPEDMVHLDGLRACTRGSAPPGAGRPC